MHSLISRAGVLAAATALVLGAALVVPGLAQDASSSAPAGTGAAPPSDADLIAMGKHIWSDAACSNCHGLNAEGGHSADFPAGPNLRSSGIDPNTMLQMVECGVDGSRMPAWVKGAYTTVACYGNPLGPSPAGTLISGAYTVDQLKALVDYVQTNFMKQPMPTWSAQ